MKAIVAAVTLSLVSIQALADTYICIGVHGATVNHKDDEVIGSGSYEDDSKFLADENGVRIFGEDRYFLDSCTMHEGRPVLCELSADDSWAGHFMMTEALLFVVVGIGSYEDNAISHYVVKGKCSKIDD